LEVKALAYAFENGKRQLGPRGNSAATNDRGEFRVFWLEPGEYYIAVSFPLAVVNPYISIQSSRFLNYIPSASDASYVTTYFPGTSDIQKAEPVQIRSGEIDVHAIPMMALARRVIKARIVDPNITEAVGTAAVVTAGFMTGAL